MHSFPQQKEQVLGLLERGCTLAQECRGPEIASRLRETIQYLREGKLTVVICGEFKQGKSSLTNALLNDPDLLPVDIDITTSIVSVVGYGDPEEIRVIQGPHGKETSRVIRREEIRDYVTERGNPENVRQVRLLTLRTPNQQLREGMVVVDTPGVGGLNIRHTDVTFAFIPSADAVLFVSDSLRPLSTPELDFVRMIGRHCDDILFVLTKKDLVSGPNYREILQNNRAKIGQVLERPEDALQIIPVSSSLKLRYLKTQDPEDLEDSNFPELEAALWSLLNDRGGLILISRALVDLGRAVTELRGPLQAEWEACREQDKAELDRMERELQEAGQRLRELQGGGAEWRKALNRGLEDIRTETMEQFQAELGNLYHLLDEYLQDSRFAQNPIQVAGLMETEVSAILSESGNRIGHSSAELASRLERSSGLAMNPFEVGNLHWESRGLGAVARQLTPFERTLEVSRVATMRASTASTIGGVVGGIVGGLLGGVLTGGAGAIPGAQIGAALGAALCGAAGAASGAREALRGIDDRNRVDARRVLREFLDHSRSDCTQTVTRIIRDLMRSMQDQFDARLEQERSSLEKSLQAVHSARKLNAEQAARRSQELEIPLQKLAQVSEEAERLLRTATQQRAAAVDRLLGREAAGATADAGWADA